MARVSSGRSKHPLFNSRISAYTLNVPGLKRHQRQGKASTGGIGFSENLLLSEWVCDGTGTGLIQLTLPLVWPTPDPE